MSEDRDLGLDTAITRKDFLNRVLIGAGGLLLSAAAPARAGAPAASPGGAPATGRAWQAADDWTGYGGVGDYAASNGNTRAVLDAAHRVRDAVAAGTRLPADDTGEFHDVIVVGGGIAGLTAAYTVARESGGAKSCLVLENHPIFGGGAKLNEFVVNGTRLFGPQASNQFGVPRPGGTSVQSEIWTAFDLPREFEYQPLDPSVAGLSIPLDNYAHMDGVNETQVDVGYFFDEATGAASPTWRLNVWRDDLARAPFDAAVRADLLRWRRTSGESSDEFRRRLDATTYAAWLERELKLRPEVTAFAAPIIGLINGAQPDVVSAFAAQQIGMPAVGRIRSQTGPLPQSFPGGNATFARHFVKYLLPDAISGPTGLRGVHEGRVDWAALDRRGRATRIRLGATVARVEHARTSGGVDHVAVTYDLDGRRHVARARAVVMACNGMMTRAVVADLPADLARAYAEFQHAPALVVNVALTNWRFLRALGAACCRWFDDGFGFSCNIRRPMVTGAPPPPMHPDQPTVLTFYMGLCRPGGTLRDQVTAARRRLLETPFADYERQLRRHLTRLFAGYGFDARRDIAGIVLNRWGHARVAQGPGFYYGRDGRPSPREVVAAGFGRIAIGHSELNGHQSATGAMAQGRRAALQALAAAGSPAGSGRRAT
ncbi:MAG: FAD/NAD(P)-binding protein [Vicinamibacterales bacterium]